MIVVTALLRWLGCALVLLSALVLVYTIVSPSAVDHWRIGSPGAVVVLCWMIFVFGVIYLCIGFAAQPGRGALSELRRRFGTIVQYLRPLAEPLYSRYLKLAEWCKTAAGILWTVRGEALTLMLFASLLCPDQSAEAIRIMADPKEQWKLIFWHFALWFIFCTILGYALYASSLITLRRAAASADTESSGKSLRRMQAYAVATLAALPFGVVALAIWTAAEAPDRATELVTPTSRAYLAALDRNLDYAGWPFLVLAVILFLGLRHNSFVEDLGPEADTASERQPPQAPFDPWELLRGGRWLAAFIAVFAVLSTWGFTEEYLVAPAPVLITAWATLLIAWILAPIIHYGRLWHFPVLTLLIISAFLWGWLDWNDNHEVRSIGKRSFSASPPSVGVAFGHWLDGRQDKGEFASRHYPVFLVAAEGGGLRAAYFTVLVLDALQARCARFAQHTFLISGVSGGSVGAALFAEGLRHNGARNAPDLPCDISANQPAGNSAMRPTRHALRADLLSPLLVGLLFPDLLQQFLFFPVKWFDRARQLENALSRAWVEATGYPNLNEVSFYDVWLGTEGAVPALMLNTTNVETGQRMIVSHLSFPSRADLPTLACINSHLDIPLSTAAILSARFPLVTPAGTVQVLPGCDGSTIPSKARYVDGGYFENSGLATILDAVEAVRDQARGRARLVIISIETSAAITNYPTMGAADPSYSGFMFGEILSPLRALLNTRQARGGLAKLEAERVVKRLGEGCAGPPKERVRAGCVEAEVITFAIRPGSVPVPLGWSLSTGARLELEGQLDGFPHCSGTDDNSNRCALFRVLQYVDRGASK